MLRHLHSAFRSLFATRRGQVAVGGLILVTATVPVLEILALRLFSDLVIEGPRRFADDPRAAIPGIVVFLVAFAVTRGAHHATRFARVRVYRDGFEASGRTSSPMQESWEWAQAFELTSVVVSLVQGVMFIVLFLLVDLPTGLVSLAVGVVVLMVVSRLFARQLTAQKTYAETGSRAGSVAVAQRVGDRIRAAETGAVLASAGVLCVLVFMLVRTLAGQVTSADAIVLFLGLRLLGGQLSALSGAMMRLARASARRGTT